MTNDSPHGFTAEGEPIPAPPVELDEATRQQWVKALAAMICGHTPERILKAARAGKWPVDVVEQLEREWEPEELSAYVDVLLLIREGVLA